MRKFLLFSFLALLVFVQTACKPDGEYKELKNAQWKQEDVLQFEKEMPDAKAFYKIVIALRYVAHIPFKELKLQLETTAPSGKKFSKDVVVSLKDAKGLHVGKVMGDIGDIDTVAEEAFPFPEKGKYKFAIRQNVAAEIGGIQEVGIKINPNK
jgi:gliding motility-associated lipoprotein GldH